MENTQNLGVANDDFRTKTDETKSITHPAAEAMNPDDLSSREMHEQVAFSMLDNRAGIFNDINQTSINETVEPGNTPTTSFSNFTSADSRPGHVGSVLLYGVQIVSLWIDGQERLCLAQISNTLLKQFSYNEIHNRRVALGITCVQCTPVQLEILRRAGAMPVSSRRCGMITHREAHRLVKSFLEETSPPKLASDFRFDVKHDCGWGCRGHFYPARYNSSRAKCVQCHYCSLYFSPNKFIFHFHRLQSSSYKHPDAANFNSWRRHLTLTSSTEDDALTHAWEDVKAMFNGGSRRRVLAAAIARPRPNTHALATREKEMAQRKNNQVGIDAMNLESNYLGSASRSKPNLSHIKKPTTVKLPFYGEYPIPHQYYTELANSARETLLPEGLFATSNREISANMCGETLYPSYEMLWARHLGLSESAQTLHKCFSPFVLTAHSKHVSDKTANDNLHGRKQNSETMKIFRPYALGNSNENRNAAETEEVLKTKERDSLADS